MRSYYNNFFSIFFCNEQILLFTTFSIVHANHSWRKPCNIWTWVKTEFSSHFPFVSQPRWLTGLLFFISRCLQLKVYGRWSSLIRTYRWTCTLNGRQNTKRPGKNVIILNIKRDLHCTLLSRCIETKPFRIAGEVLLDFKKTGFIGF